MGKKNDIPTRSRQANRDLIDLTDYYTASLDEDWLGKPGANLTPLPQGVQVFAEAAFDVRGLIQLAGKTIHEETEIDFPQAVNGIEINYKGRKLHFLHGTAWSTEKDAKVGEYVLHYANGQIQSIPIIYQRHVRDWWIQEGNPIPTDADIAWTGENKASHKLGYTIQIYRYSASNPFPNEEIKTIDFVSAMTESAPFLIALTIEPNETVYEGFSMARIDDFCPVAPRSSQASPDLVDLSKHYTSSLDDNWFCHAGHDLRDLPRGVQVLGGVAFDVRGLVQLAASKSIDVTGVVFPEAVKGIAVHRAGRRLHFLQACFWNTDEGAKLGEYVIHYADGQTRTAPILYGQNIMDWWVRPGGGQLTEAETVWRGTNPATSSMGLTTHLIKYTWENPLPEVEISTIDFVSDLIEAGPFLVAITVEPNEPAHKTIDQA
ncbi:MAG: hypothetical protein JXA89_08670 [Anaerolineae bacterium]|nr:hypothetical protein [Anaerolineae bacterium]